MEAGTRLCVLDAPRHLISRSLAGFLVCLVCLSANAASFRTRNFIIQAPTPELARSVGESAERYRHDLAVHWTGDALPAWPAPCPIRVIAGPRLAAQGVTTYNPRPVRDFQMEVVGTPERILDSVLPHEVTHTILATYFGRPLPRWADEGICTTVEHASERNKHEAKLREFLRSRRGIAMNQLFLLTEYPSDVLPMYAQGYSVCNFLIQQQDARTFVRFLGDYMKHPSWTRNIKKHYGYESLAELQEYWLAWVESGSGAVERFAKVQPATRLATNQIAATDRSRVVPASATASGSSADMRLNEPARPTAPSASVASAATVASREPAASIALVIPRPSTATALASTSSKGWYSRQRMDAQNGSQLDRVSNAAVTAIVPPSIRNSGRYRSAQPQPEQQMSRSEPLRRPAETISGIDTPNRRFR